MTIERLRSILSVCPFPPTIRKFFLALMDYLEERERRLEILEALLLEEEE